MNGKDFQGSIFPFPIGTKVRVTTTKGAEIRSVDCLFDGWGVYSERLKLTTDVFPVFKKIEDPTQLALFEGFNGVPGKMSRYSQPRWDDIVSVEVLE